MAETNTVNNTAAQVKKYCIGADFGTLSVRCVLCGRDGKVYSGAECAYEHGVIEGGALPDGWALQNPLDYLPAFITAVKKTVTDSGVDSREIGAICIDFTASSPLAVGSDGQPLCSTDRFKNEPLSNVLLWKHHGAEKYAEMINEQLKISDPQRAEYYGGGINCEWFFPKLLQVYFQAPELYGNMSAFVEAGDWFSGVLCGKTVTNLCAAGYKMMYNGSYPSEEFFASIDEGLRYAVRDKVNRPVVSPGEFIGYITENIAEQTGLPKDCKVGASVIDGHASIPSSGVTKPEEAVLIMGTSACHMVLADGYKPLSGICGAVMGGVYPGVWCYESGQSCFGEHYSWFADNCTPASYRDEAKKKGISVHTLLQQKASVLEPGASGLVALDWFGGNRCTLNDPSLSGLILGITTATKPEEIYSALVQATAFGSKTIFDNYINQGISINTVYAEGGIANKSPYIMQTFADILGLPVKLVGGEQGAASGAAVYAMYTAGFYESVRKASEKTAPPPEKIYYPDKTKTTAYSQLYACYSELYKYFGTENGMMKKLRQMRNNIYGEKK